MSVSNDGVSFFLLCLWPPHTPALHSPSCLSQPPLQLVGPAPWIHQMSWAGQIQAPSGQSS